MIVYIHRSSIDGKPFYVGCGRDKQRAKHWSIKDRSLEWFEYAKLGYTIDIIIIKDIEEANQLEGYLIKKFGRIGIDIDGTLVNRAGRKNNRPVAYLVAETIRPSSTFMHSELVYKYKQVIKNHQRS